MLRVALTGGIACGKSVVSRVLRDKGCLVHSADEAAHRLMAPGGAAWRKTVARFGDAILRRDQTIDRERLGRIVFADPSARHFMNALVHPLVMAEEKRSIARLEREGRAGIYVSEAALTIEAGYAPFFDKVIVVHCSEAVQVRRLRARNGISEASARKIIRSQMPTVEKLRCADYVIDTSGSLRETIEQTEKLYAALFQEAEIKRLAAKKRPAPNRRARR